MASKDRAQRIGIWIIAVVMTVGTLGSFAVIILSNNNQQADQAAALKTQQASQQVAAQQQAKAATANAAASQALPGYAPAAFDPASVTTLGVQVLQAGTGATIKASDSINSSYFGWTSDGKIFDSSLKTGVADAPPTFALNKVISGWTTGLTGVKVGSTVKLTIPAAQAYGSTVQGIIPANSPLEFIVVVHKIDNSAPTGQ